MAQAAREGGAGTSDPGDGLPSALRARLALLAELPPPAKLLQPENWISVLEDVHSVVREGWAAMAISLGWSDADLFGVGPRDDWEYSGLAVWLQRRDLVALDESGATAVRNGEKAVFVRGGMGHGTHPRIAPVMLWEFGR